MTGVKYGGGARQGATGQTCRQLCVLGAMARSVASEGKKLRERLGKKIKKNLKFIFTEQK